jgi:hypothetical protein
VFIAGDLSDVAVSSEARMKKEPRKVLAWAWLCDFGLCRWAEPDRERLIEKGQPSPEARPVRVELVYHKRKRKAKP